MMKFKDIPTHEGTGQFTKVLGVCPRIVVQVSETEVPRETPVARHTQSPLYKTKLAAVGHCHKHV